MKCLVCYNKLQDDEQELCHTCKAHADFLFKDNDEEKEELLKFFRKHKPK